jgi:hypothetical protein
MSIQDGMFHLGGVLADLDPGAAAFGGRHDGFAININAVWAPPEPDDVAWVTGSTARTAACFPVSQLTSTRPGGPSPAVSGKRTHPVARRAMV